jgi:hypothetical protein
MIRHVALLRFNSGTHDEDIDRLMASIDGLQDEVAGMTGLERGVDFSGRGDSHTHAVVMSFDDRVSLQAFYEHPAHQAIIENLIKPISDDLLIADFEVVPSSARVLA